MTEWIQTIVLLIQIAIVAPFFILGWLVGSMRLGFKSGYITARGL